MKIIRSSSKTFKTLNGRLFITSSPSGGGGVVTPPPDNPPPVGNDGTLTLTEFTSDMWPFQRVGTSKNIDVAGTCDPSRTSVQVRTVVAITGGAVFTQWTSVPASGGTFLGKINVPQSDWLFLEATDGTNTTRTTKRFGVGVIAWLIGQSNMENRPKTAFKSPLGDKRSIEYHRTKGIRRLGNINDAMPANTTSDTTGYSSGAGYVIQTDARGDGYVYVANLLAQSLNCIVCLVERAVGGSDIVDWVGAGSAASDKWGPAAAAIQALGGDCELALWYQGETNANLMSIAIMKGHLSTLLGRCHTLTGRNASNFSLFVMSLGAGSYGGSSEGEFGNMRAACVQFANETPGAFFGGAIHDSQTNDGVHILGESHARIGARNVACIKARLGLGVSGAGPRIISATRVGLEVTLTLQHSGGTALLDGAGGTGTALTGFEFKDAGGVVIPYTSAITSPTTIKFILNSAPTTVSYAMMNCPHNVDPSTSTSAIVFASCVYDNVPIHGSTVGCPIQPLAAMPITGG